MSELFAAFGVNWKLLVVQAINFSLLLLVLWRYLYTPILRVIDERQQKIAEGVKIAEEATQKLSDAERQSEEAIARADREAEDLVAAARTQAGEKGIQLLKEAEARAAAVLADAEARAEEAKRQAFLQSEREIGRAAMLAAEKILSQKSA